MPEGNDAGCSEPFTSEKGTTTPQALLTLNLHQPNRCFSLPQVPISRSSQYPYRGRDGREEGCGQFGFLLPGSPVCPKGNRQAGVKASGDWTVTRYVTPLDHNLAQRVDALDEDAREFYEERAGILEYEAGFPRPKAEALAWEEVQRYLTRRSGGQI